MIGFGSSVLPSRTRRSGAMTRPLRRIPAGPDLGLPPGRTEGVERDRADVVPPDLLAAEDRAVHAGPDHPGNAIGTDNWQHAGHANADPAGHRFLDRHLHRQVIA